MFFYSTWCPKGSRWTYGVTKMPMRLTVANLGEIYSKVIITFKLCLFNKVLREVVKENIMGYK